jgi:hypothetical protein
LAEADHLSVGKCFLVAFDFYWNIPVDSQSL